MLYTNKKGLIFSVLTIIGFIFLGMTNAIAQTFAIDFDGDGKADPAIFRQATGEYWHYRSSDNGNGAVQFGLSSDLPVPADYTGDGITDIAVFRRQTGEWFILRSEDGSFYSFSFGINRDFPIAGDFDGDKKADVAVYRRSAQTWYILKSSGGVDIKQFGSGGDFPLVADFDGDGKDDISVYRARTAEWWLNRSRDGVVVYRFGDPVQPLNGGGSTPLPLPADYTGDGKADVAYFRQDTAEWFVLRSEDPSSFYSFPFGIPFGQDIPAIGDYDGDGKTDAAIFRRTDQTWYIQQSTDGFRAIAFGNETDIPLSAFRLPL